MLNLDKMHAGDEVKIDEVIELLRDCYITKHAIQRMTQRGDLVVYNVDNHKINWRDTFINIKFAIRNSLVSYVNIDIDGNKSINCCIDEYNYFVFAPSQDGGWCMVTYKEPSHNKINVFEKQKMAMNGFAYYYHDKVK